MNYTSIVVHCSSCLLDILESPTLLSNFDNDWRFYQDELHQLILTRLYEENYLVYEAKEVAGFMSKTMTAYLRHCIVSGYENKTLALNTLNHLQTKFETLH
ncbi:hypothetical protein VEZ01S_55_00100 [Vibrio ezurae NBRC 102218]|uniref:Uncharacterized protein n=1 Tax=Vibrio ezurae NBRC 102218 TaxID=1219080 RepID=U3CJH3_9VIBR|nr:hypothetical protein VEZ01S_55_00100 [Vibrio ezurae NBRC 102218]